MLVDLHTHSNASDGQYSPRELVELAKAAGVQGMALTDHDTVEGVADAVERGTELGLQVLPGIELSAAEYRNLHILGYGVDPQNEDLLQLCMQMRKNREEHVQYIVEFLRRQGVSIDLEQVKKLAGGGSIGRPHFAQVMVQQGVVQSSREAFDRYLDTPAYNATPRKKIPARQCIEAILAAGGKPVLAHPYQLRLEDGPLEEKVKRLISWGLEGIECYYPKHTIQQQRFYLSLAEKYGLGVTAGSDFHGEKVKPDVNIRPVELDVTWLFR